MTYLLDLHCSECARSFLAGQIQTYCPDCQAPLLAHYDLNSARSGLDREEISHRPQGMWRWQELLPVQDSTAVVSLGEGDTPLLEISRLGKELGIRQLYVKDESRNPTGSFKARGLAAAVSKAGELGIQKFIMPTAGNAGGALAAYAARGQMKALIVMPKDTPLANIEECRIAGADMQLVDGTISDAGRLAREIASTENWFDLSTFKEPYRLEGKKVMGYELAEAFGWELPEVIVYPTGGGTGLVGMWKAFDELEELGWLSRRQRPRLVVVQAAGCAPVVKAFASGADHCDTWENAHTIAAGLRVPKSFADRLILRTIQASNGTAIAVSDEEIHANQRWLATQEGIFAAPEGAATLAGLVQLIQQGWIRGDERVVLFNTGAGLKYLRPAIP